jgi:hypothetical protein
VPSPRSASHGGRGGSMAIRDALFKQLWHELMPFGHLPSRHAARAKLSAWTERSPAASAFARRFVTGWLLPSAPGLWMAWQVGCLSW